MFVFHIDIMMFYEQFTKFTLFVLTEHMGKSFSRLGRVVNRCGLHCPASPYTFSATFWYIPLPALPCFRLSSITHFLQVMSGISIFYFHDWDVTADHFPDSVWRICFKGQCIENKSGKIINTITLKKSYDCCMILTR